MNKELKDRLLPLVREAKQNGVDVISYKSFTDYLKDNHEYNMRCHLMPYKYLYGSLIKEAISI
jgi:hypothetical protein